MKRRAIAMVCGVWLAAAACAWAQDGDDTPLASFQRGNAAYEAGDYAGAIDEYTRVVDSGVADADLFYNLGNASFKMGDLGKAVLWYERARRLAPRDPDLSANLDLTRSLLRDQQLMPSTPRWRRALLAWHRDTTTAESAAIASALLVLVCALGVCFVFRDSDAVARVHEKLSVVSPGRLLGLDRTQDLAITIALLAIVGGAFGYSAITKASDERSGSSGVVVSEEVSVFSGPSRDASVQFKVHEGTRVSVRDARPGWVRIDLAGDLSGWIDESALDRI